MTGRVLFAAIFSSALALAWADHASPTARALRDGRPVQILLGLRSANAASPYLLIYRPDRRALDFIYLSDKAVLQEASAAAAQDGTLRTLAADAPAAVPCTPDTLQTWLNSVPRGVLYWRFAARLVSRWRKRLNPPLPLYDSWLLAAEFFRLGPEKTRMRWLSSAPGDRRILERLMGSAPPPAPLIRPTVQILNASGRPKVALQATKLLRWRGLDVLAFGNAPVPSEATRFWDRTGDFEAAERLAAGLGCRDAAVATRTDPSSPADVTLVLGRDFENCSALSALKP